MDVRFCNILAVTHSPDSMGFSPYGVSATLAAAAAARIRSRGPVLCKAFPNWNLYTCCVAVDLVERAKLAFCPPRTDAFKKLSTWVLCCWGCTKR
jgi:hypothetical protein